MAVPSSPQTTPSDAPIALSVLAPCFNEEGNIPEFVDRTARTLDDLGIEWELVLVDDGSSDRTWEVIEEQAGRYDRLVAVRHESNRGMVAAWRSGFDSSRGRHICIIDTDLQYQPEDIARLWQELHFKNVDIAQGCRNSLVRIRDRRYTLSRGLNWMLNRLFSMNAKDNKSGFILTRRSVFQDILEHRRQYRYFQTFILVAAKSKGYTWTEVDTVFEDRLLGESFVPKTPLRIVLNTFLDLASALLEFRFPGDLDRDLLRELTAHEPARAPDRAPLHRRIWKRLYFATMPAHHWLISSNTRHYLAALERTQYLPPSAVKRLQEKRLRRLIEHSYYNVSYWRQTLDDRGIAPTDIRTLEDLQRLPLLSKDACRENLYRGLIANRYDPSAVLKVTTSGSTGEPFVCFADKRQLEIRLASTMRSLEWSGYRFGDRQLRLWHQTLGMTRSQVLREILDAAFLRRRFIPVFDMNRSNLARVVKTIKKQKPVLVDGYAEAFNLLAQYLREHPDEAVEVDSVMSSAQTLPAESRAIIERSFGAQVYDKYGSREFSGIAYECAAHDGHHVVAESYIVEILRDGQPAKPGEVGEVVITDLNNFTMPLIRYRIGDLAVAMDPSEACGCGRGLPRLGRIEGRVQSIVVGADNRFLPGTFFAHALKDFDRTIRKYQIVQERLGEIDFFVVKGPRFSNETFDKILAVLRRHLGDETVIRTEFVDDIEMVRTGKHNAVVSKLKIDFQRGTVEPREGDPVA